MIIPAFMVTLVLLVVTVCYLLLVTPMQLQFLSVTARAIAFRRLTSVLVPDDCLWDDPRRRSASNGWTKWTSVTVMIV